MSIGIPLSTPGGVGGLSPVASISRRDAVMNEIRRGIVSGSIRPGDKLTEVKLATMLSVSRPTIREALTQLAQEGLLVQEPYRGLRVATLDTGAIMDIARTRMALDMLAVTSILDDTTGRRMKHVEASWEAYDKVAFDPDPVVQHEAHIAFHRSLWAASENSLLLRLWPATEAHLTIVLAQDQAKRADPVRAHEVHEQLVKTLRTGEIKAIEAAFATHTIDSALGLIALLQSEERQG
ncbi:GntR family transcriptional regulator [Pseudarthrobacter raffinosi]|uniref:GntR family transcriptional regulator n=1 Tax=Pseudarthrobacter raffinosi TaxID=2953651 RepID=UPI00208EDDB7|nr:GntR family transcriptional regulator [Pseudarthrobacter sp. MDT3-9]MCO4252083.1 GntR family transcriptional regulator [Pseudarthrobacter sp. MDT3-9]